MASQTTMLYCEKSGWLVGAWIKRREVVVGARRIRSEKLREHQYREGYAKFLEGKELDGMKIIMSNICGSR